MTVTATGRGGGGDGAPNVETFLIDTDVHEGLRSPRELLPYLDAHWQQYWELAPQIRLPGASYPYATPPHVQTGRRDWGLSGGSSATDVDAAIRHLFDELGVSIAILNSFNHLATTPSSPEYGAAIARAYTDWQVEHWLEKDPRFRGVCRRS